MTSRTTRLFQKAPVMAFEGFWDNSGITMSYKWTKFLMKTHLAASKQTTLNHAITASYIYDFILIHNCCISLFNI